MKICIDARCLMEGRRTGVEEYTLGLLSELFKLDQKNEYVLFINSWKKPKFDFNIFSQYEKVKIMRLSWPNKLINFLFWYLGWPKIDQLAKADVVFWPNIAFGAVSCKAKLIVTIHDLSFERYPRYYSWKRRLWHVFINPRQICQRADKIVAVSESTKNDLTELYKIEKNKISVIYSAVGEKFKVMNRNDVRLVEIKKKYNLPFKFILFLGTIEPRKNIIGVVKAYNALRQCSDREKECVDLHKFKLIIAGEQGWKAADIFAEIDKSPYKQDIQIINCIAEEDKEYLYNLASLFIYPSFFEGFGFPPLEAMKCGVSVISSNNSSLPEVIENAGILIDPDRTDEIYRAMKEILLNKKLNEKLIEMGLRKSRDFSWEKSAKEFIEMIEKM